MAFVLAAGLAVAKTAEVQSPGWVERDGVPYQLQNETCTSTSNQLCKVRFTDDPNTVHQVYTDASLQVEKQNGTEEAYIIED